MARISRSELAELTATVSRWHPPSVLAAIFDRNNAYLGGADLFNQPGLAILRDTYIAATFATARQAVRVRVLADAWPDFEVDVEGNVEKFEAVLADDPERRIGEEYRNDEGGFDFGSEADWIACAEQAPAWLANAARKKAAKQYATGAGLLIYLNMNEFGIRQREVEASFACGDLERQGSLQQRLGALEDPGLSRLEGGSGADGRICVKAPRQPRSGLSSGHASRGSRQRLPPSSPAPKAVPHTCSQGLACRHGASAASLAPSAQQGTGADEMTSGKLLLAVAVVLAAAFLIGDRYAISADAEGRAVFMVDQWTGQLFWCTGAGCRQLD